MVVAPKLSKRDKWREMRRQLLGEQNWRCAYCGCSLEFETATIDHVIARSRGGGNDWDNLVVCCFPCNQDKARTSYLDHVTPRDMAEGWSTIAPALRGFQLGHKR